jgi:hypothetical protein
MKGVLNNTRYLQETKMNRYNICLITSVAMAWSVSTVAQAQQPVLPTMTDLFATVCTTDTAVDGTFVCQLGDRVLATVTPGQSVDGSFSQGFKATFVSDFLADCQAIGLEQGHHDGISAGCGLSGYIAIPGDTNTGWVPLGYGASEFPFGTTLEQGSLQITWPNSVSTVPAISSIQSVFCGCAQTYGPGPD